LFQMRIILPIIPLLSLSDFPLKSLLNLLRYLSSQNSPSRDFHCTKIESSEMISSLSGSSDPFSCKNSPVVRGLYLSCEKSFLGLSYERLPRARSESLFRKERFILACRRSFFSQFSGNLSCSLENEYVRTRRLLPLIPPPPATCTLSSLEDLALRKQSLPLGAHFTFPDDKHFYPPKATRGQHDLFSKIPFLL